MATTFVIVFMIHRLRNRVAALELLGSFKGTLGSDRWTAYHVHGRKRRADEQPVRAWTPARGHLAQVQLR